MERTLIILKPDCLNRGLVEQCTEQLLKYGKITHIKHCKVTSKKILEHYKDNLAKHPIEITYRVIDYFVNETVIIMVIEGEDIISKVRKIVGASDPSKSKRGTIRGDYGIDSYKQAIEEKRSCQNLIHASDSENNYQKEYKLWFEEE